MVVNFVTEKDKQILPDRLSTALQWRRCPWVCLTIFNSWDEIVLNAVLAVVEQAITTCAVLLWEFLILSQSS